MSIDRSEVQEMIDAAIDDFKNGLSIIVTISAHCDYGSDRLNRKLRVALMHGQEEIDSDSETFTEGST